MLPELELPPRSEPVPGQRRSESADRRLSPTVRPRHRAAAPKSLPRNNESGALLDWVDGVGTSPSHPTEEHLDLGTATGRVLGFTLKAASILGTFLRSFRWGHVRQLDRVSRELLARAWAAGAGPGAEPLTIDLDSTIRETYGLAKQGARGFTHTGVRGYHPRLAIAAGTGEMLELEADHRGHAEIDNAIRDLKYGVALNHLPSGRFAANGAWLPVQVMAHNLARWTARIGPGDGIVTTKTLRRRLFGLVGRLTRSARRLTLHLPARWPWAIGFSAALTRLRAIPLLG